MSATTYKDVDPDALHDKVTHAYLFIIKELQEGDTGEKLFNYIRDNFSYADLLMFASVNIARDVNEKLSKDPHFRHLATMARLEDLMNKKRNK